MFCYGSFLFPLEHCSNGMNDVQYFMCILLYKSRVRSRLLASVAEWCIVFPLALHNLSHIITSLLKEIPKVYL